MSKMLTVWRRLHIEVDSMFPPPNSTGNPNRNFFAGDIKVIKKSQGNNLDLYLYESNTTGLTSPLNLRDVSPPNNVQDGSPDLSGVQNPTGTMEGIGNGRFEKGIMWIGNSLQTVLTNLIGNGNNFIRFAPATSNEIVCMLVNGNNTLTSTIKEMDFNNKQFTINDSVKNGDYTGGTITIAGKVFHVTNANGPHVTVMEDTILPMRLFDDDTATAPFLMGESDLAFDLMKNSTNQNINLFAPAYVQPIYDIASSQAAFIKNYQTASQLVIQLDKAQTTKGSPDYWVASLLGAFQGVTFQRGTDPKNNPIEFGDADPASEVTSDKKTNRFAVLAETPIQMNPQANTTRTLGTAMYIETIADQARNSGFNCKDIVAVHEVGHQFGLLHEDPDNPGSTVLGIMSPTCDSMTQRAFIKSHIKIIRNSANPQMGNN